MSQKLSNATRSNLYLMSPEDLIIACDKDHPLYDERKDYAINERQVVYMMRAGCDLPVIARKEGEQVIVIDGRQRVQAAREANKRLAKEGTAPADLICLPVVFKRADDGTVVETMIASNSFARTDSPLTSARKVLAYINRGKTAEQAAEVFNCHVGTINSRLSLLESIVEVQKALEKRAIGTQDAIDISKLPREEQKAALDKALQSNGTAKVSENGTVEVDEGKIPNTHRLRKKNTKPGKATIRKIMEDAPVSAEVQAILRWVLGDATSAETAMEIKGFPKPKAKKEKVRS